MVKTSSVSLVDVDFIKEFEQLKIKQRLLLETLKKKNSLQGNKVDMEINSKLDFLVKLFKDSLEDEKKENLNQDKTKIDEIKVLSDKITSLETSIQSLSEKIEILSSSNSGSKIPDVKQEVVEDSPSLPPEPEFSVDDIQNKEILDSNNSSLDVKKEDLTSKDGEIKNV